MAYNRQQTPYKYMDGHSGHASRSQTHSPHIRQPQMVAPDVPTAVSNLLDATRRLEDSLRRWGALEITETEVSDVFVTVGNCYNEMLAAFSVYHIDMRDVATFLTDLRTLLEECLSEDPTPQNLNYLIPQVRTIIANLLVGLRNKQAYYWRAVSAASGSGTRRSSGGSQTGSRSSSGSGYR